MVSGVERISRTLKLSEACLEEVFGFRYGAPVTRGWRPTMDHRFGYFAPDTFYEALLEKLVTKETAWLDVGCGRSIFPSNPRLARALADRCAVLVGIDPGENLDDNIYVHQRYRTTLDRFRTDLVFDLVTLRMVAEHIETPERAAESLSRLTRPGGRVLIYTAYKWSPLAVLSRLISTSLRRTFARIICGMKARDSFPLTYEMNTRSRLARLFAAAGFAEESFTYMSDAHTFYRSRVLHLLELSCWRGCQAAGLHYPEKCLLGVYEYCG
jgi:SAM-dependent methyltransferase